MTKQQRPPPKPTPSRGYTPIAGYTKFCGWCGKTTQVVTDGRMMVCAVCGK